MTQTHTPLPTPTVTVEIPKPETALNTAFEKFDHYTSYTVITSFIFESGAFESTTTSHSTQYVNTEDEISLLDSESTAIIDAKYKKLCLKDKCYKTDATGLFKPSSGQYYPATPSLGFLDMKKEDILESAYLYSGEEEKSGRNTFKYQIQATESQMNNPDLKLAEPLPEIYFFVDQESGDLVASDYVYHTYSNNAIDKMTLQKEYADHNSTVFDIPEYTDLNNTEWQAYNGEYSSVLSFNFPQVYFLSEEIGWPNLKTPAGGKMDLTFYETIATISVMDKFPQDARSGLCGQLFNEFVLAFEGPSSSLLQAEWIEDQNFDFCKAIIDSPTGQRAEYLFNEPLEMVGSTKRLLPETFRIIVTAGDDEDVHTIFWDVIQTIQLRQPDTP